MFGDVLTVRDPSTLGELPGVSEPEDGGALGVPPIRLGFKRLDDSVQGVLVPRDCCLEVRVPGERRRVAQQPGRLRVPAANEHGRQHEGEEER